MKILELIKDEKLFDFLNRSEFVKMWQNQDLFSLQKEDPIVVLKHCRYIYDKVSEEENQMSELVIEDPRIKNSPPKDILREEENQEQSPK